MRTLAPWLLLDVGNTAIKWRLADEHGLLEPGGIAADLKVLQEELRDVTWQRVAVSSVATDEFDASLCASLKPCMPRRCGLRWPMPVAVI